MSSHIKFFKSRKMKIIAKNVQYLFAAILLLSTTLLVADIGAEEKSEIKVLALEDGLIGSWAYTVENTMPEYSKGVIVIAKESGEYSVQVQLVNGSLEGQDITVKGNEIVFNLYIEGQSIKVVLVVDGDKISGESSSMDGVFKIDGTRRLEP